MKFHDELNQKLFNKEELKPEVKEKLKEIAEAFIDYLEVNKDAIKDVVITGSSVSYNYTKYSDIDLHLKVDYDLIHEDCPIVEGYLWACKSTFNKDHDITIYGIPVEVYAESIEEDTVHNGLYSLWQDKWIDKPNKIPPTDNDSAVLSKYNELKEAADRIQDSEVASELIDKIYQMRKAGLQEAGEFSTENLAFKKLRDEGIIERLREMKKQKIDKELSLESYNEGLAEPTGELAVFAKRRFSNVTGKPQKDFYRETDYKLSLEDAEKWINKDMGYDRPGIIYQIRDKEGNVIKEVKWTDIYNTKEHYDEAIKYLYKYGTMDQIAYVLRLANPDIPQEKIDKKIEQLKAAKEYEDIHQQLVRYSIAGIEPSAATRERSAELRRYLDKNESIKESEDKLDYEQFKIAKSNFGTYFVTPYDSRIGRIEGSSAVTVSNKLAAAINKYNSKSIAAERKALINKLHKLFKQAGIPKMQDMKSSIRGYRPITQNGYYIEIYKGDYTTFNIGITGNREELGNKIKEILNNEGVKYTGSVDYFTVDMEKQDNKNKSIKESQEELIKEANKITNHGMLYMPVRKLAAKLMDRVKGTSDEEALKVAKMFFKETKNESIKEKLEEKEYQGYKYTILPDGKYCSIKIYAPKGYTFKNGDTWYSTETELKKADKKAKDIIDNEIELKESINKLEETLKKATDREINEGMWASPFTMENAKRVAELLAKPITYEELNSEEGKQKYWNIIGDDEFWDNVADEAFDIPEADARYLIVKFLEDWIETKENFNPDAYSQKAEDIIKKAIFMFNGITEDMGKSIKEDRLFKKQLTPLPSKDAKLNKGDKVTIDGQNGEIIEVKPMKMSDTCTYKIKLDNGKVIWRYEEEIINEEVKTSPLQRAISRAFAESEAIYKPSLIYAAYKLEQQWLKSLGLGQDEQAPEIMLFVINNPEEGIEDTKLVKREDVYTYTPEQNEYYLDMTRDSGDVITDYNLEPAAKLVDSWNLKEDAQTLTDKVDKAEQELQDIIKMVKVGYQENNKLINNLNKLINEALEK